MKTNTLSKMMALALLCAGAALAPAAANATYTSQLKVMSKPYSALPGTTVHVVVSLGYQDPRRGNVWFPLARRPLVVDGSVRGGTAAPTPLPIRDVVTDSSGRATITFIMPSKRRNAAGREIGTAVDVSVIFRGEMPNFTPVLKTGNSIPIIVQ